MAMTDFKIIRRSLLSRLFSNVITVLMVATAVGLMIVLIVLPDAGRNAFMRGNGNMHMLVSRDPSSLQSVLNGVFYAEAPGNPIEWSKYQQIIQSYRMLEYAIPIQQGDSYRGYPVLSTTSEFFSEFKPHVGQEWKFAEGREFKSPFEVVIGADAALRSGIKTGDTLILTHGTGDSRAGTAPAEKEGKEEVGHHHNFTYSVVGVLEPTGGPHDRALFTDLESAWIIHAHDRRQRESGHVETTTVDDLTEADRLITGIYLRVATREGSNLSSAQQMVFNQLRADTSITVADPIQEIGKLFAIVDSIDQIFLAMAVVVMVSSGISIMLALYNSMEQRRRQIAVLRVLGCSRQKVFGLVVTESAILGVTGAVAGIALAWLGVEAVSRVMNLRLGLAIDSSLPVKPAALVAMGTIMLASLAGLIPAFMAYRTPVIQNLRPLG